MMLSALNRTIPGWTHVYSGKVRDMYVPADATAGTATDTYLMVASDRISAFDYVLPSKIPDKGKILTQLSLWWFEQLADIIPNHVVSTDVPEEVAGRAIITRRLDMFPIECVARGYLTGAALSEYRARGANLWGVDVPTGLVEADKLPEPIFTPAAKARLGEHDEYITFDVMSDMIGNRNAEWLRRLTLDIYGRARDIAGERGIIIADTKIEFGTSLEAGEEAIVLADEVLTPDSARFWRASDYEPGHSQPSYDKQYVRDWLLSSASGWSVDSGELPPPLPEEVIHQTRELYIEVYELLTGRTWQ